jgi:hypothetical protein
MRKPTSKLGIQHQTLRIAASKGELRELDVNLAGRSNLFLGSVMKFAALACFCAGFHGAWAQEDQVGTSDSAVIQGTVINEITGEGIGHALVFSGDNRFAVLTDVQGRFQFNVPKPKADANQRDGGVFVFHRQAMGDGQPLYSFQARKPGFVDRNYQRAMVAPGDSITISLLPEAIIAGRVLVSDSDAAMGIPIQLFMRQVQDGRRRWTSVQADVTNSNGDFRFADLMPGAYKVMTGEKLDTDSNVVVPGAQVYAFPPVCFPGVNDFGSGTAIQIGAGQTFQADFAVTRQPYFPVRIPIRNFADGPMNVRVLAEGHPGPGYALGYNPQSQRIEGLLPKGQYLVEATTFATSAGTGSVNMTVAGSTVAPTMTIVPGVPISVNVTEQFNSTDWQGDSSFSEGGRNFVFHKGPRTYLNIFLESADDFSQQGGAALRRPLSPNDNALVIENVTPGQYWVRTQTARGYVASATVANVDLMHEPLTVAAGSGGQIEITMRDDSARLEGSVIGLRNSVGVSDAESPRHNVDEAAFVYCVPLPGGSGQFQQIGVSSDGKFSSQEMAPGAYRVLAFERPQPMLPYRDAEAMRAYESQGQVVNLISGQIQHLEVALSSGAN